MEQDIIFTPKIDDKDALRQASSLSDAIAKGAMKGNAQFKVMEKIVGALTDYLTSMVSRNKEVVAESAKQRAAFATAMQPLYEMAVPVMTTILRLLTSIATVAAKITSILFGGGFSNTAKNAKALEAEAQAIKKVGGAAKAAQKSLAGFDEINKLNGANSGGGGGGGAAAGMDFSSLEAISGSMSRLEKAISGFLLALGAILTFSGVNIPLGLGLLVAGSLGLAAAATENWGEIETTLGKVLMSIMTVLSSALFVIGCILMLTGNIPLGIGMIIAGAAGMAYSASVDWDLVGNQLRGTLNSILELIGASLLAFGAILTLTGFFPIGLAMMLAGAAAYVGAEVVDWTAAENNVRGAIDRIADIAGKALLAIGVILLFTGVATGIGLAMILAGGAEILTAEDFDWDFALKKLKESWENIKSWWDSTIAPILTAEWWAAKFSAIGEGFKAVGITVRNALAGLWNDVIAFMNGIGQIHIDEGPFGWWEAKDITLWNIPPIPMLAQGAVIPPNAPFMAMLGDQRNGTNLEAPEALIRQIVREEAGGNGELIDLMKTLIATVAGIQIGDEVIGKAADRYSRTTARAYGR